ncbi:MAG: hypothetical protein JNM63_08225, partial [Spirochaetia bacterium]|nr:hypothetical protein [Spirochaetia bacterium]
MRHFLRKMTSPETTGVTRRMGRILFSWKKTIWLYGMMIPTLIWSIQAVSWRNALLAFALFVVTFCLGHTVGLHRGMIHRAFSFSPLAQKVFAYLFVHIGLGGPLAWIHMHYQRDYWQNRSDCPRYFAYRHSLLLDYFWNLHTRFVPGNPAVYGLPKKLISDPWLVWLEKTWYWHVLGLALLIG